MIQYEQIENLFLIQYAKADLFFTLKQKRGLLAEIIEWKYRILQGNLDRRVP